MKTCAACKEEKAPTEFGIDRARKDGLYPYCAPCRIARQRSAQDRFRSSNPGYSARKQADRRADPAFAGAERNAARRRYAINAAAIRERKREYAKDNPDQRRRWVAANRDSMRAIFARYRAAKLKACPAWADHEAIRSVYEEAQRSSQERGENLHVDHIVPLQGENVCGLHVHWNLQILTASQNQSKGNRLEAALAA